MKTITTVCARDCYDTCSLLVTLNDSGQIISIKGDPEHPISQGFTCPRGAKDHERLYKNRVEFPYIRQGEDFKQIDWETALEHITRKLNEIIENHGPESLLFLDYAGNMGLLANAFPQRLWHALGATQTDHALCSKSGRTGLELHYGESYGISPDEIPGMQLLVFWGFNAAISAPHLWSLAKKARDNRGAKLVVIDPINTRTAQQADLWIRPAPGTDVALAYGLISFLIQEEYLDRDFIAKWTIGFDQLAQEAAKWPLSNVESFTGVNREDLIRLGQWYHTSKPNVTLIGIGMQKCANGADHARAVSLIPALLGLHRGFYYSNSASHVVDDTLIRGKSLTRAPSPIVEQVALGSHVQQGEFKAIYINCMNPALTLPNQQTFRAGLTRNDVFVVVHDTHWTKTAEYADVVLPAPTYLEKEDLIPPWGHSYVRYSPKVIEPVTDSRTEVWVMQILAKRLGLQEKWLYTDPWTTVKTVLDTSVERGDLAELKTGKLLKLKRKPKDHYSTRSGKIELVSSRAVTSGFCPLPVQSQPPQEKGMFRLLASSTANYTSTQFQEVYGPIPAEVSMHPLDAERLGIEEGQVVALMNEYGRVKMTVTISTAVPEGVLWAPRQSQGLDGSPQNALMTSTPQDIGRGPRFNSTTVRVIV